VIYRFVFSELQFLAAVMPKVMTHENDKPHSREHNRREDPKAPKFWMPRYQEWLSADELAYRKIRERESGTGCEEKGQAGAV
jgi:hypothetical protein